MTFHEELVAHKGGLILLKSELYWYGGRGWDRITDRTVLLMDACAPLAAAPPRPPAVPMSPAPAAVARGARAALADAATLLLIDGRPHWVWVGADDLELL
jgi:hypothetical protein